LLTSPSRAIQWINEYRAKLKNPSTNRHDSQQLVEPQYIWEPSPNSCVPSQWNDFVEALKLVHVVSPNHEECLSLVSEHIPKDLDMNESSSNTSSSIRTKDIKVLLDCIAETARSVGASPGIIIRAAERGCLVATSDYTLGDKSAKAILLPAYWAVVTTSNGESPIKDVTGAGNSFMGGLLVGLEESGGNLVEAAKFATVSSSFTVELLGPPKLTVASSGSDEEWNDKLQPRDRLAKYESLLNENPPLQL
jgi:sugar/nucleoside kinase (ribokinase family)